MALKDLLEKSSIFNSKQGISEARVREQLSHLRNLISFFRAYPDIYIDFVKGEECTFKFYTYQRIFLRIVMRHRYVFATFARAYSKSFLSMMALILKATFYPGAGLFVTTGGKELAVIMLTLHYREIVKNKVFELLGHPKALFTI